MACGRLTVLTIFVVFCAFISVNASKVIDLTEENWRSMLKDEWMVEFYAPWCPACKGLQNTWNDFASWSKDLGISVAKVDVTTSPGLSGRFMVTALPTIFHVYNGQFRQYKGSRDKDAFFSFIEDKKWKAIEPVSSWNSPDSIQMTIVSAFFKLSQVLRHFHNILMEDYGLPYWGSYLIFAVATILLGAVLGLVLVCIIDLIYPQKYQRPEKTMKGGESKKDKDSDDELADEDIKDDLLDDASQSDGEKVSSSDNEKKDASSKPNSPVKKRKSRKE